jgi:hypothetical protein
MQVTLPAVVEILQEEEEQKPGAITNCKYEDFTQCGTEGLCQPIQAM